MTREEIRDLGVEVSTVIVTSCTVCMHYMIYKRTDIRFPILSEWMSEGKGKGSRSILIGLRSETPSPIKSTGLYYK